MFGSHLLDLIFGLGFVYLLFALACTALNELITGWWDHRREHLERGIKNLLNHDDELTCPATGKKDAVYNLFYNHPFIKSIHENGTRPSYIPPELFAKTLIDLIAPATKEESRNKKVLTQKITDKLQANSHLQHVLATMVAESEDDLSDLNEKLENWFEHSMDRVSAWYKRHTQKMVVILATALVVTANADTLQISRHLANDSVLRQTLAEHAEQYIAKQPSTNPGQTFEDITAEIKAKSSLGLPLGWKGDNFIHIWTKQDATKAEKFTAALSKFVGLLLTIAAASLGAPFWFDMLNKIISIRSVGKSPREKAEKAE